MTCRTMFRDDMHEGVREAWQDGKVVYKWSFREIDRMHSESAVTVPEFGKFKGDKPVYPILRNIVLARPA